MTRNHINTPGSIDTDRQRLNLLSKLTRSVNRYCATGSADSHRAVVNLLGWTYKLGLHRSPEFADLMSRARTRQTALEVLR